MKASEALVCIANEGVKGDDLSKWFGLILAHLETIEKAKTRWVSQPAPSSFQPCYEEKKFHPLDERMVLRSALALREPK